MSRSHASRSLRSRSRSRYVDDYGDFEEERVVHRERERDDWRQDSSPGPTSRTVERKGDSMRVTVESNPSRRMYNYSQEDIDNRDTRHIRPGIRHEESYRRSPSVDKSLQEDSVFRERRHSRSPDEVQRGSRVSRRYYDDYENDGTAHVDDLWPGSDVGSDSEYSLTLVDEDNDKKSSSEDGLLDSINGDSNNDSKKSPTPSGENFDFHEIKVFPTKHEFRTYYMNDITTSILVDEDSLSLQNRKYDAEQSRTKKASISGSMTLFRWLHLKQEYLNFDQFKRFVLKAGGTSHDLRKDLTTLLQLIEREVTPIGTENGKGREMRPSVKYSFNTTRRQASQSNILLWLSFPFLSLEPYQQRNFPDGSLDHPPRTLMQMYDSNQSRSRDLQQAVTKYDGRNADKCLHVSQLWCLLIDQSLIITCAQLDIEQVRGKILDLIPTSYPLSDSIRTKMNDLSPYIYVHDGGNCTYLFPVDQCQTWFEFLSRLTELGDLDSFQVFEGKEHVNAFNWTDLGIAQRARLSPVQLTLRPIRRAARLEPTHLAQQGSPKSADSSDNESSSDHEKNSKQNEEHTRLYPGNSLNVPREPQISNEDTDKEGESQNEPARGRTGFTNIMNDLPGWNWNNDLRTFRVFTWMCATSAGKGETVQSRSTGSSDSPFDGLSVNEDKLATNLKKMHAFLGSNKRPQERSAYKRCWQKSYKDFHKEFTENLERFKRRESRSGTRTSRSPGNHRRDLFGSKDTRRKNARSFAHAAERLFACFLPLHHKSAVGHKFWGGVNRITWQILFERDEGHISARVSQFEEVAKVAADMSERLSDGRAPPPNRLKVSSHFYQAFMSIIIFIVSFQPKEDNSHQYQRYIKECTTRINNGMRELVDHICTVDLSAQEAVLPAGIMAIVVHHLHQDITYSQPDLVYRAYREYLNRLDEHIRTDPKNRNHQVRIVYVKQELSVILRVLIEQGNLLDDVCRALGVEGTGHSSKYLNSPEGRAISMLYRTSSTAKMKLNHFRGLAKRADDLFDDVRLSPRSLIAGRRGDISAGS